MVRLCTIMTDQEREAALLIANPFYCLRRVDPVYTLDHQPLIDEELFVKSGVNLIGQIGAAEYIRLLLENLKKVRAA